MDWERISPEAAGFAADLQQRLDAAMASGLLRNMHAVAVARDGKLVAEAYGAGEDEHMGDSIGHVVFGPEVLHDLRSVTKSVVGLLYGIALERGLAPGLDTPIIEAFSEYAELAKDEARRRITVRHALSMTMGLEWDESLPYSDPRNNEIAMELAADRYRFALDRPIVEPPGQRWIYSGGAVALLGAVIARGTGMDLTEFAREALFAPLGIKDFAWWRGADGVPAAASGLRLTARDLLRTGAMVLDGGRMAGRQIVPQDWIAQSFALATKAWDGVGYGYLWYLGQSVVPGLGGPRGWVAGFGYGGQRLYLMPEANIAVVTFAGDYGKPDFWIGSERVWTEIVLGNLRRP